MKTKSKALSLIFILAIAAGIITGCDGMASYRKCEGAVWATSYHITYRSDRNLDDSIMSVMRMVENSLSPFSDSSLVSRINRGETDVADSLFCRVFLVSQDINRRSGGVFDPTVAPLVNLWGFGYRNNGGEPTAAQIDSARALVGIQQCHLNGNRVVKRGVLTEFDFSAITKGYGCDIIGEMLQRNGCSDFLIEIGGEVVASGSNLQGEKWRIMVDAPVESDTAVVHSRLAVIAVTDCGVATSGNYRNYRNTGSGKVWHTISPLTGYPARSETLSATVVAKDAMTADALATACMAMPVDSALAMIKTMPGTEALIVTASGSGYSLHTTPGFPELI